MTETKENRRSFRVSETVYVRFEVLSDEEFEQGLEHRKLQQGSSDGSQAKLVDLEARLNEALFLLKAENTKVTNCLSLLNEKLNVVVEQLPSLRKTKASLTKTKPQYCDVSADGMIFSTDHELKVDDKLHLQALLSSDNRYLETFCRVVRVTDPPDSSDAGYRFGIGVEFVNMPSAQREILIQYMFSRESESLRIRRLEIDENGEIK
jgi:hypothetical protein